MPKLVKMLVFKPHFDEIDMACQTQLSQCGAVLGSDGSLATARTAGNFMGGQPRVKEAGKLQLLLNGGISLPSTRLPCK